MNTPPNIAIENVTSSDSESESKSPNFSQDDIDRNSLMDSADSISPNEPVEFNSTRQLLPLVSFSQIDLDKFPDVPLDMPSIIKEIMRECNSKRVRYKPGSEHCSGTIFTQKGYSCESEVEHKPFSNWGFHHTRTIYHYVIFYYRTNDDNQPEMFAMTTGQAWQAIQKFADFNFPSKIAKRILSKKGMSKRIEMPLFGNKRKIEVDFEDPEIPDPLQPLYIPFFISRLRENASILKLDKCFSASQLPFVTVGNQIIRFKQTFAVEDVEDVLDHLSKVSRQKVTYTFENGKETGNIENDYPQAQSNNLVKAKKSDKIELDNDLKMLVFDWLKKGEPMSQWLGKNIGNIDNFYLGYKHFEDFNMACSFELRWKEKKEIKTIKQWDTRPKLMSLINAIRESDEYKNFTYPLAGNYVKKFPPWFSKLRFAFTDSQGQQNPNQNLLQFIQGDMYVPKDGRIYWHLNNQWFQVMDDYLALVNCEFKKLIGKYLMGEDSEEHLKLKYPNTKKAKKVLGVKKREFEGKYNKRYEGKNNFIVGDKVLVYKIEMFDLLFYDEENERTYLYHVKEEFGQKMRDVASQIINSALLISGILHSGDTGEFHEFCMKIVQKYKDKLPKICANVTTFKAALKNAHFVYAFADTASTQRSFSDEMTKKDTLDQVDLENKLSFLGVKTCERLQKGLNCANSPAQISNAIIDKLKACGYADPQSKVTAKLIHENAKRFKDKRLDWLKGDTDTSDTNKKTVLDEVFKILSQLYCTSYESTLAKLELLRIPPKLIKHGFNFKICEIEVEEAIGD